MNVSANPTITHVGQLIEDLVFADLPAGACLSAMAFPLWIAHAPLIAVKAYQGHFCVDWRRNVAAAGLGPKISANGQGRTQFTECLR
jgi:hypothetical protein